MRAHLLVDTHGQEAATPRPPMSPGSAAQMWPRVPLDIWARIAQRLGPTAALPLQRVCHDLRMALVRSGQLSCSLRQAGLLGQAWRGEQPRLRTYSEHAGEVLRVALSDGGSNLLSLCSEWLLVRPLYATLQEPAGMVHQARLQDVSLSGDGTLLCALDIDRQVVLASFGLQEELTVRQALLNQPGAARLAQLSGDGASLVVASWDWLHQGTLHLTLQTTVDFPASLTAPQATLALADQVPVALCVSRDASLVAVGLTGGRMALWRTRQAPPAATFLAAPPGRQQLALTPDGTRLAIGGGDGTVALHRLDRPDLEPLTLRVASAGELYDEVASVCLSHDGYRLAAASRQGNVAVWDLSRPWPERVTLRLSPDGLEGGCVGPQLALNADGRRLVVGTPTGELHLLSLGERGDANGSPGWLLVAS